MRTTPLFKTIHAVQRLLERLAGLRSRSRAQPSGEVAATIRLIRADSKAGRRLLALSGKYGGPATSCCDPGRQLHVLFVERRPVAFGELSIVAPGAEVARFLVRSRYRRRGYGKAMIEALEAAAHMAGAARLRISVAIEHADALSLLVWLGYQVCTAKSGRTPTAILFEKMLGASRAYAATPDRVPTAIDTGCRTEPEQEN